MQQKINHFRLRHTKDNISVICSCCNLPFARINVDAERVVISSKHADETHTNAFTIEDLEQIILIIKERMVNSFKT